MNKKVKLFSTCIFIAIEIVLWILVLSTSGEINRYLSFSSILLAFMFSLLFVGIKTKKYLTQFALMFTVVADIFLVLISPRNQVVAMTSFAVVQMFYFVRILFETKSKKINIVNVVVRLILIIAIEILTLIILKEKIDYLSMISMFYYVNLILNVVFAFINFKKSPLLAFGLLFFLLCDTFVGLQCAVGTYFSMSQDLWLYKLIFADFNFVWFFYIPSQTLLAISSTKKLADS